MKKGKKIVLVHSAVIFLFSLLLLLASLPLRAVSFDIPLRGISTPVRIAILADLHGRRFGKDNERLLALVEEQKADAVFLVGDMLAAGASAEDIQQLVELIAALSDAAPVYFAPGNHELSCMETDAMLLDRVAAAGAVVVNDSYADVCLRGQLLRIGGTMGHAFPFGRTEEAFAASPEYRFLKDFENTDVPKLCLAHMPDTFIFNGAYGLWDVDLVISGHTHGGLVRLPLAGGLYAPMQGLFPAYDRGLFQLGEHMQLLITSGLAGYGWIPRINNPPEIAVVTLLPAEA